MATFDDIRTRVVNKYKGSSGAAFTIQAGDAINDAITYYKNEHFWFREGIANITLTVGDPELTTATGFPTDYWYMRDDGAMAIVQSQSRYPVRRVSVAGYDSYNTEGTGRPYIYRQLADKIQVYFYPDQAYTLEFRYIKDYPTLSGTNSNDFTTYAPLLIEVRALSMLFLSEGQDGEKLRRFWDDEEQRQLRSLRETNQQRITTGNLTTDEFGGGGGYYNYRG